MEVKAKNPLKAKRELRETRDKAIKDFINNLSFLISAVLQKNPKDNDFKRRIDEYNIAKKDAPEGVVKISGPPVWDYRKDIAAGNIKKFLMTDYTDDIKKYSDGTVPDEDLIEEDTVIIDKIKRTWHLCTPAEQSTMLLKVQQMVQYYAQYLSTIKQLQKLGDNNI
jgi:hypothetical protein